MEIVNVVRSEHIGRCGVYHIVHIPSKKYYVGSTSNFYQRYISHMSKLRRGNHNNPKLQELFERDDRIAFTFCETNTYDEAVSLETETIRKNWGNPNLLNAKLTLLPMTQETIKKISERGKGRVLSDFTRQRIGEAARGNTYWLGRKHTEEAKAKVGVANKGNQYAQGHKKTPEGIAKIRETHLGRRHTEEARLKVSLNSTVVKRVAVGDAVYRSITEAATALNTSGDTVRRRALSDKYPDYSFID